jgi:hypothetical protein
MLIIALTGEMIAGRPKTLQSYLWDITLELPDEPHHPSGTVDCR